MTATISAPAVVAVDPSSTVAPAGARLAHDFVSITRRLLAGEIVVERCESAIDSEALRCDLRFRGTPTERLHTVWPKAVVR